MNNSKIMECGECHTANVIDEDEFKNEGIFCTGCDGLFIFGETQVNPRIRHYIDGGQT